jgi:hypothetical protein
MYVSLGTDLVVPVSEEAGARARAKKIADANARLKKDYETAQKVYENAKRKRAALIEKIASEKIAYETALARYQSAARGQGTSNSMLNAQYQAELARWQDAYNKEYAYGQAVAAQSSAYSQQSAAVQRKWGVSLPAGYRGCLDPSERARYVALCQAQSTSVTVKGLGIAVTTSEPGCAYAELPVCSSLGQKPPSAGSKPSAPTLGTMPTPPPPPPARVVPPEPVPPRPPVYQEVPRIVVKRMEAAPPIRRDPVPMPAPPEKKSYAVAGLLMLAAVVGGGAYYLSKKKKGQAA